MLELDASKIPQKDLYKLIIGSVVPRPIAWVTSQNKEGIGNCAPFSFFSGASSNPPCISISITKNSKNEKKDTLRNIEATGVFCINLVSEKNATAMNQTSAEYPYGINEAEEVGLSLAPCKKIEGFRIQESLLSMECRTYKTVDIGTGAPGSATLVIGEILYFHIAPSIYHEGKILTQELNPLARLAGSQYATLGKILTIDRS